jgi:biopolymer transport protein ExbD
MSHALHAGGVKAEPNLTPMLDVVMNLLVFFILGFRLITEQVDYQIRLPLSQSARPLEKGEGDVLFLNLSAQNKVSVLEGTERKERGPLETKYWLREKYEQAERRSKDGTVNLVVVIRADRGTDYEQVYRLMRLCKEEKFRKLRVRADIP